MNTKIYKVITNLICLEDFENTTTVKVFYDRKLAMEYFEQLVQKDKQNDFENEDYNIDEEDCYYERYLKNRMIEDCVSIRIEDDEICEKLEKNNEMEKDYDM